MLHTSQNISIFSYTILIILQAINSILLLKIINGNVCKVIFNTVT
jgi:hypothetical protein